MFIKVMFYKGYEYNDYDLKMIDSLIHRKENKNNLKELITLKEYYIEHLNHKRTQR